MRGLIGYPDTLCIVWDTSDATNQVASENVNIEINSQQLQSAPGRTSSDYSDLEILVALAGRIPS